MIGRALRTVRLTQVSRNAMAKGPKDPKITKVAEQVKVEEVKVELKMEEVKMEEKKVAEKPAVNSVAGNKAPLNEETVHGRYTGVLFSAASEKKALSRVLEDMNLVKSLMDNSEAFRNFL